MVSAEIRGRNITRNRTEQICHCTGKQFRHGLIALIDPVGFLNIVKKNMREVSLVMAVTFRS